MIFKNLTDRVIFIVDEKGRNLKTLSPEPHSAFATMGQEVVKKLDGILVVKHTYHNPSGLPKPEKGVILIVKYAVLKALKNSRPDVVSPDTNPSSVVRDEATGKVLGVRNFQTL
jgi:hypothetical protein